MSELGIANVVSITAIVYIIGLIIKATNLNNKWIPSIAGIAGILLGILALAIGVPNFPATDYLTAAAVGGASGLAATGINEVVNQLQPKN